MVYQQSNSNDRANQVQDVYQNKVNSDIEKAESFDYNKDIEQISSEVTESKNHLSGWFNDQTFRYKLFNNQRKLKNTIGDNTLFNIFQTVLAGLYSDTLGVTAEPNEDGDNELAENLTNVFKYDYIRMDKDELDYVWDFYTLFHGAGICSLSEFDSKTLTPIPEVWDSMATYHDPYAISPNGD